MIFLNDYNESTLVRLLLILRKVICRHEEMKEQRDPSSHTASIEEVVVAELVDCELA